MTVHLTGFGTYVPDEILTGEAIADESGIPEDVVVEKMGLRQKHVCPPDDDHVSDMSVKAGRAALADAGYDETPGGPSLSDIDLVVYHGSEYKDYIVWSVASTIAERLDLDDAYATEEYALCAGAPIAIRRVRAQLETGDIDRALLVAASREEDLIDYTNQDASFMFNFGSGASAAVMERNAGDRARATINASAAITDGSFANDVIMPAGGSREPPSHDTVANGRHTLDVPDHESMKERLGAVSLPNFLSVTDEALAASGYERSDIDFVALVHMKRSFHETVLDALGLDVTADGFYLEEYGHVQSADQLLALEQGIETGRVSAGDVIVLLAAGTGYTWAATIVDWLG